jgi:hypothetical protein
MRELDAEHCGPLPEDRPQVVKWSKFRRGGRLTDEAFAKIEG